MQTSKGNVVKVSGELNCLHFSADVEFFYSLVEVSDRRVGNIVCPEHLGCFSDLVKGVDVLNREDSECLVISGVEECEAHTGLEAEGVDLFLRDIEGDGDGEERAICESQVLDHATSTFQIMGGQSGTRLTSRSQLHSRTLQAD